MSDRTSTQTYFLAGLLAALVLVPVLVLAATTSPATVQDGTTFNASAGPEITAGEDMNVATNDVFPNSETVQLGDVNVSHAGQIETNLTGADTSLPTIRPQASPTNDLQLAHDNTSLSAAVTGGSIDSLALSDAAAVGDATRDIELDTGGTGTTLTVSGLTTSQVTFIDTSGSQNQDLATKSVSGGEASLSVGANAQRDILLATSPAAFDVSIDATNSPIVEGQDLTVAAIITNTGGAPGTQTVTLDAGALGTSRTSVTLASGASQTVTVSLATSTGDVGTYTATLSSDDDSDSTQVTVLEEVTAVPISGTVTDPSGTPIDGADVFVGSNQTQTLQGNYAAEVPGTGTFVVTAATAVDSKTRTVTVTDPNGTSGVDFVLQRADSPNATGNLEIRFENTGALVNNRTVTVRFFDDSEQLVATRNTTTGLVSLAGLSQPAPLVAVAEADGLFSRRIVLNDLGENVLFLLDGRKASGEVVVNEFEVRDNTGRFSAGDTQLIIKRAMPLPGETDNIPLRVLGSDLLGADGRFGIALESDVRYRIQLVNDDGDVRDLGPHVVTSAGVVVLEIGEVTFEREDGGSFRVGADAVVADPGGDGQPVSEITFRYDDPQELTEQVSVRIYNRSNESQVIVDQTFQPPSGAFGNVTVRKLVLGEGNASADWTVEYSIVRANEDRAGEITVTGRSESLNIPMSQGLQQVLGVGMVIIIGGLFSRRNAAVGAVIVPLLAGALFLVGALSGVVTGAAVAFALTLGVGYNFATRGS